MACIKNIGCFCSCDDVIFPYEAIQTGEHVINFNWLNTKGIIKIQAIAGELMVIPNFFNEHSDVTFTIKQPSGDYFYWSELVDLGLITCPDDYEEDCTIIKNFFMQIEYCVNTN